MQTEQSYPLKQNNRFSSEYIQDETFPVNANYECIGWVGRRLYYEFALEYNRQFGAHKVSALALMNRQIIESKGNENIMQFPSYTEDWVGRITYNWKKNAIWGEVNMAYTGSEKLHPVIVLAFPLFLCLMENFGRAIYQE